MPNNIKLLKWSELFSRSLPTDKSVAILTEGDVTAQDRADVIDALALEQADISYNFNTINTASHTVSDDETYILSTALGAVTITLSSAVNKKVIYIKNDGNDTHTIQGPGDETINGVASVTIEQGDVIKLVSDGEGNWYTFCEYVAPA
jgi:hypothetical protein